VFNKFSAITEVNTILSLVKIVGLKISLIFHNVLIKQMVFKYIYMNLNVTLTKY